MMEFIVILGLIMLPICAGLALFRWSQKMRRDNTVVESPFERHR